MYLTGLCEERVGIELDGYNKKDTHSRLLTRVEIVCLDSLKWCRGYY